MVSVLRTLQAEWNELVPQAQARGIRRVRALNAPLETIEYRRTKLEWLRQQLGSSTDLSSLTFGVEIEFVFPRGLSLGMIAREINGAGVGCEQEIYNHSNRTHWKVVTDASVDASGSAGGEVVSPVLRGEEGFRQLRIVCQVLTRLRCKVNKRCGFHVHVGARGQTVDFFKNLVVAYSAAEQHIDSFMAPSRRGTANGYCQPVRHNPMLMAAAQNVDQVVAAAYQSGRSESARGSNRYRKLNLMSFWQHGTVEFRQHQGTVESQKAENWVRFCLRMCLMAAEGPKTEFASVDALMTEVKATPAEKNYFVGRVAFFANRAAETVSVGRVRGRRFA